MVEEAKHSLNDDARKTLKKLAKERKLLKEKNSELENQVVSMQRELREVSLQNSANKSSAKSVGDLQQQIKVLRVGLEKAVKQEDLVAEAKSWKARCLEAVEHLETMKHDLGNRKQRQVKLEKEISSLNAEIRELSEQHSAEKSNSSHRIANLGKENGDLSNEVDSMRQTLSLEKEKSMDEQARFKELELKYGQLKRDLDRSAGKVVDLQEQVRSCEEGSEATS